MDSSSSYFASFNIDPGKDCNDGICNHVFEVSESLVGAPGKDIDVSIFGTNILGNGSLTNTSTIGIHAVKVIFMPSYIHI